MGCDESTHVAWVCTLMDGTVYTKRTETMYKKSYIASGPC